MYTSTSVISRSQTQVSCDLNDEVAILETKASYYYGANEVGVHVWRLLEGPRTVAELCRSVEAFFDVEPDTCFADIVSFLSDLEKARLIDVSHSLENKSHA